jgi:hypothetical protein
VLFLLTRQRIECPPNINSQKKEVKFFKPPRGCPKLFLLGGRKKIEWPPNTNSYNVFFLKFQNLNFLILKKTTRWPPDTIPPKFFLNKSWIYKDLK